MRLSCAITADTRKLGTGVHLFQSQFHLPWKKLKVYFIEAVV